MKRQVGLVRSCLIGALLGSVAWAVPGMQAHAGDLPEKAPPLPAAVEPIPYWWFHGEIDVGGRFFTNDPQRNGKVYQGQQSLAKYYEYNDVRPGAFGNIWLSTGTKDGLYQVDVGGKNIGYEDQDYYLTASKAGQLYFNFDWDQTPHKYSTSAQTFYQGVGSTNLTLPFGFPSVAAIAQSNTINPNISKFFPFLYQTDLGIRRDTGSAQIRWTPDDAWDIKAEYSHLWRDGTQIDGVVGFGTTFPYGPTQVPRPVDDVTQNYGVNGEYQGTSPWGKRYTFKLAYNGSTYTDSFSSYTIANPFNNTSAVASGPIAALSTWPSNNSNSIGGTLGADLPWESRYMGTVNYTWMRQNEAFIPMSTQAPGFLLPASSLNGSINTWLSNNILTTKITPELTSKLSYRYYDFDNQTPQIFFPCQPPGNPATCDAWIPYDKAPPPSEQQIQSLSMAYIKQNAGVELNWRPTRDWNLGAAYGYEHYNYTQVDASSTAENSGRVYGDWKPWIWLTVRASGSYSDRTANNYNYVQNVGLIQFPGTNPPVLGGTGPSNGFFYSPAYRQLMIDDRQLWKAKASVDLVAIHNLTITPTFSYMDAHYPDVNGFTLGLQDSKSWAAGIDATYVINPVTSISVGYMYENIDQQLIGSCSTNNQAVLGASNQTCGNPAGVGTIVAQPTPLPVYSANTGDTTTINTFTAVGRYEAIPDKLSLSLRYTASVGVDNMKLNLGVPGNPTGAVVPGTTTTSFGTGQFPNFTTWFQRLDAEAAYKFDKVLLAQLGWKGEVVAKLHYVWENNSVANWQNDPLAPYNTTPLLAGGTSALFMAYDNPNYNVQMLLASLQFKW